MASTTLPAVRDARGTTVARTPSDRLDAVADAMEGLKALRTFVKGELKSGLDFGEIPGTGKKPTLLLPGAQKIGLYFNVCPKFAVERTELGGGHLEVYVKCRLVTRSTRELVSEGLGSCSSMEKKYRYHKTGRACPACGSSALMRSKRDDGWWCNTYKEGCGANFRGDDPSVVNQDTGRTENPDIWDVRNTVLKIAKKRAQVDASLNLGAMSEMFTQDLDDVFDIQAAPAEPRDPEPPPALDGSREAVNRAFAPKQAAKAPGEPRRPPPRQEAPPPADEDWQKWSARLLKEANDAWHNEQAVELNIPRAARTDLDTNVFRLTNALVTLAAKTDHGGEPLVDLGKVTNAEGKRDRDKVKACAEWLLRRYRDWTVGAAEDYLAGKAAEQRAKVNPSGGDPDGPDPDGDYPPEPGSGG